MRVHALFATLSLALVPALAACSDETAIVLVITAGDETARGAISLDVHIGAGDVPPRDAPDDARWFARTTLTMAPLRFEDGLGGRTYELMLRAADGLSLDDEIMIAIVGRTEQGPMAFGPAADFVRFAPGEVRRVPMPIAGHDPSRKLAGITETGCLWWSRGGSDAAAPLERYRAIVPADDLDCDGWRATGAPAFCERTFDCDDTRAVRNPGLEQGCDPELDDDCCDTTGPETADTDRDGSPDCEDCADDDGAALPGDTERCDGLDHGCDGFDRTTTRRCVPPVLTNGACHLGNATCTETAFMASYGACLGDPASATLPERFCRPCLSAPDNDPFDCNDSRLRTCNVFAFATNPATPCAPPAQQVPLVDLCPVGDTCTWTLVDGTDVDGWQVTLTAANILGPTVPLSASYTGEGPAALRALHFGPLPRTFLVRRTDGTTATLEPVRLRPQQVFNECAMPGCSVVVNP